MSLKLLLAYDIKQHRVEDYYRFIMGEFLPRAQGIGLVLAETWQTTYGDYPARLIGFLAKDDSTVAEALTSDEWDSIETKLGEFVLNYEKKVVPLKNGFQFFSPRSVHE